MIVWAIISKQLRAAGCSKSYRSYREKATSARADRRELLNFCCPKRSEAA